VKVSTNAFVYVTDRDGWRVQIFTIAGKMRQPGLHCTVGGEIREIAFSALRHKAFPSYLGLRTLESLVSWNREVCWAVDVHVDITALSWLPADVRLHDESYEV